MSDPKPTGRNIASALQATATILLTFSAGFGAVSYFVGALYQEKLARLVGLPRPPGNDSLQWTMTQGARVIFEGRNLGLLAAIEAGLAAMCAAAYLLPPVRKLRKRARARLEELAAEPPKTFKVPYIPTAVVWTLMALAIGIVFGAGYLVRLTAINTAFAEHIGAQEDLVGPCKKCWVYWTRSRFVVGIPMFQSDLALYVLDRNYSIQVIEISDLRSDGLFLPKIYTREAEAKLDLASRPNASDKSSGTANP